MIIFAQGTFTVDCSQTVGRTDFGRTSLKPALKGQYKFFIVKNLRYAIMDQYAKKIYKLIITRQILMNLRLPYKKILAYRTLIAAGGQKAGRKHYCSTSLEPAFQGQQKSVKIQNLSCIWTIPHAINEPKRLKLYSFLDISS